MSAAADVKRADPISRRDNTLVGKLRRLGWLFTESVFNLGLGVRFSAAVVAKLPYALRRFSLTVAAMHAVGVRALVIILVSGLFIGMVLGLQFNSILSRYGQEQLVGAGVALTLFRELGPVTAALLFVGCACTAVTAGIGLKKAGEQIAAIDVMAVDPLGHELAPRLAAMMVSLPLLTIYFNAVGIFGAYLVGVRLAGLDSGVFWSELRERVFFHSDFTGGLLKSAVFAVTVSAISLYEGYFCTATAEGVSRATTRTVVKGSLAVLGLNFLLTSFLI